MTAKVKVASDPSPHRRSLSLKRLLNPLPEGEGVGRVRRRGPSTYHRAGTTRGSGRKSKASLSIFDLTPLSTPLFTFDFRPDPTFGTLSTVSGFRGGWGACARRREPLRSVDGSLTPALLPPRERVLKLTASLRAACLVSGFVSPFT